MELQSLRRIQGMSIREVTNGTFNQHKKKKENMRRSEERRARRARLEKEGKELDQEGLIFKDPPVFVYADYYLMQNEEGEHHPILVCCEIDEDEGTVVFYGENCCEDFLDYLDELAVNEDGFEQSVVMLLFHNLKGYDGMFVF